MSIKITTKPIIFHLLLRRAYSPSLFYSTTIPSPQPHLHTSPSKTPLEKQFESWINHLKPGFTPTDVDQALKSQSDPDLALDIFRWTSQQRSYKHTSLTYLTTIKILISGRRYRCAETLVEEVLAGACDGTIPLYNFMIRFCCGRKFLFNRSFDIYNKMLNSEDCHLIILHTRLSWKVCVAKEEPMKPLNCLMNVRRGMSL